MDSRKEKAQQDIITILQNALNEKEAKLKAERDRYKNMRDAQQTAQEKLKVEAQSKGIDVGAIANTLAETLARIPAAVGNIANPYNPFQRPY